MQKMLFPHFNKQMIFSERA
jgi:hypothetical protein